VGTLSVTHTVTADDNFGTIWAETALAPFTGDFTVTWTMSATSAGIWFPLVSFAKGFPATYCWTYRDVILTGQSGTGPNSHTVGNPPGTDLGYWSCTDWDKLRISAANLGQLPPVGTVITLTLSGAGVAGAYCEFGTELSVPGKFIYYVTPGFVDVVLAEAGVPWAAPFFTALYFSTIDAEHICGTLPPPTPNITLATFGWAFEAVRRTFESLAWWHLCQCKSGASTPVEPPKPVIPQPPGMPDQITWPCDPALLCNTLVYIQQQLAALAQTVASDYQLGTLVQRYRLPFAVIPGAKHSGLTGSGSIAMSRLIGMRVELVGQPPDRVLEGQPPYLWDVGWMSVSDGGAMLQERRITRSRQDWLPPECAMANVFGYYCKPGVSLDITELEAEP
jgi:hypothetical protein